MFRIATLSWINSKHSVDQAKDLAPTAYAKAQQWSTGGRFWMGHGESNSGGDAFAVSPSLVT